MGYGATHSYSQVTRLLYSDEAIIGQSVEGTAHAYQCIHEVIRDCQSRVRSFWFISSCREVAGAVLRREAWQSVVDNVPEAVDGACRRLAQDRLELGEGVLDWVEVGRAGRELGIHPVRTTAQLVDLRLAGSLRVHALARAMSGWRP